MNRRTRASLARRPRLQLAGWGDPFPLSSPELEAQRRTTTPIPGRDGWRRDSEGREWYSAEWLGRLE